MGVSSLEKFWVALLTLFILDVSKTTSSPAEEWEVQGLNQILNTAHYRYLFKQKFANAKGRQTEKCLHCCFWKKKKKKKGNN